MSVNERCEPRNWLLCIDSTEVMKQVSLRHCLAATPRNGNKRTGICLFSLNHLVLLLKMLPSDWRIRRESVHVLLNAVESIEPNLPPPNPSRVDRSLGCMIEFIWKFATLKILVDICTLCFHQQPHTIDFFRL